MTPLIALLCLTSFSNTFSIGAFPAILPELAAVANLSDWQLGTVAGVFGFARMAADIPVGLFLTHHLRRVLALGPCVLALGALCLVSGGPLPILLLGRSLMGLGHALGIVGGLTTILRYHARSKLASALNAYELSAMIGILSGTVLIGSLPARLSWNEALLVTCTPQLVGLLVIPAVLRALPVSAASPNQRPVPRPTPTTPSPLTTVTPAVVLAFIAGGAVAVTYSTVEQFIIPLRGSREFALERSGVARLLMAMQFCDIAALLPVGLLADRLGVDRLLPGILVVMGTANLLIGFGALPVLAAGCALLGLSMAGWMLPLSILRRETPPDHVAWRTGLYRVAVDGGIFLGPFLAGLLGARHAAVMAVLWTATLVATGTLLVTRATQPPLAGRKLG